MSFDGPVSVPVLAKKAKKPDWTGLPSTTGYWAVSLSGHSFWIRQFRLRRHLPGLLCYLRKTLLFLQQFRLLPRVFRHLLPFPPLQFLLLVLFESPVFCLFFLFRSWRDIKKFGPRNCPF